MFRCRQIPGPMLTQVDESKLVNQMLYIAPAGHTNRAGSPARYWPGGVRVDHPPEPPDNTHLDCLNRASSGSERTAHMWVIVSRVFWIWG